MLNFEGSDTMSAAYHAQFHLNGGKPVATSIPATEHSVMTAWDTEEEAMLNEIEHFGSNLYACVMDSYDYDNALDVVLPKIKEAKIKKGGTIVLRPDSGDPVEQVGFCHPCACARVCAHSSSADLLVPFGMSISTRWASTFHQAACSVADSLAFLEFQSRQWSHLPV